MTKEERRAFSHALYIERRRRKKRQTPRAEWLARSLSRTKPWEAEGISRSTWERRRNKALTQVGGNKDSGSRASLAIPMADPLGLRGRFSQSIRAALECAPRA